MSLNAFFHDLSPPLVFLMAEAVLPKNTKNCVGGCWVTLTVWSLGAEPIKLH